MPRYDKIPTYLNPEQRQALMQIPLDLSDRDNARYYTFTEKERELINPHGVTPIAWGLRCSWGQHIQS